MSFGPGVVLGRVEPRLATPPLRELTPETSYGFDVIDFADQILGITLDPWEQWCAIHLGELLEDGRPRFRTVLILVARQNGKTLLSKVLTLYWMFIEQVPLVLSTSNTRDYAKQTWRELSAVVQTNEHLRQELPRFAVRSVIGEESITTIHGSVYKIAASNRQAGRSLTVHRLIMDEIRELPNFDAWNAATHAMNAVPYAQAVCISNQGDHGAVVLDSLRLPAIDYIETGRGDARLGLFEYSSPAGSEPTDLEALAYANPNLGYRIDPDALVGSAMRAVAAGGEELAGFRTEVMCQRVHLLDPAVDPDRWADCGTIHPIDLAKHRQSVACCVDISLDGSHASLIAAAVVNGKVHIEVIEAWQGYGCTKTLRIELPDLIRKIKPRVLGWFPNGPAASVAADLGNTTRDWPPRRVLIEEIKGDQTKVCMGFSEQVTSHEVVHPRDPMLTQHVLSAQKLARGDAWVFTRKGTSAIDGTYAAAGAVHLARTLPPPLSPVAVA